MTDQTNEPSDGARDDLLLQTLMDLVPHSELMEEVLRLFGPESSEPAAKVIEMLKGYGTLLCVIQAASEYDDEAMTDRLYAGYYELTNNEPID